MEGHGGVWEEGQGGVWDPYSGWDMWWDLGKVVEKFWGGRVNGMPEEVTRMCEELLGRDFLLVGYFFKQKMSMPHIPEPWLRNSGLLNQFL